MIFSGFLRFASPDPADFQNRPYTSPRVILPLFALLAILLVAPRGLWRLQAHKPRFWVNLIAHAHADPDPDLNDWAIAYEIHQS